MNEFLADNKSCCRDEGGDYDDWLELYNADTRDWDLSGSYLTDNLQSSAKWRIPDGTVLRAGEFLLFWCDEHPWQGPLHTNFKLSKSGEEIGLFDTDGNGRNRIDNFTFGPQVTDRSQGRSPDGSANWIGLFAPSPGDTNSGIVPVAGLAARAYNTVVDVTWKPHPDPGLVGYDVLGTSASAGPYLKLNSAPVAGLLFRDTGLVNGPPRWYKVRARFANGQRSRDPAPVTGTPLAGLPTPIVDLAVTRENGDVVLRWSPPTNDPALVQVDVFRDEAVLLDSDVDLGLHWYATAPVPGPFVDAGEGSSGSTWFYLLRPVDEAGQRATE